MDILDSIDLLAVLALIVLLGSGISLPVVLKSLMKNSNLTKKKRITIPSKNH